MLDALSFALFGKAHRNINKPQLVNSINKKNCLVEVEFTIGKKHYKIVRGINPGIFEIWVNGSMMNQSSHSKEYQRILEQNILKLNHKSFHQVVVLGSSSFIPFMQLPQGHRRAVIEDLLDIGVFSKMNYLLREKNSKLKEDIKDVSHQIDIVQTKREAQRKYITNLNKLNTSHRKEKEDRIDDFQKQIDELQAVNAVLVEEVNSKRPYIEDELKKSHNQHQSLLQRNGQINSDIKNIVKNAKFYEDNDNCPTCHQNIDSKLKASVLSEAKGKARELSKQKDELVKLGKDVDQRIADLNKNFSEIKEKQDTINTNISSISHFQKAISRLEKELQEMVNEGGDIVKAQKDLEALDKEYNKLVDKKVKYADEYSYNGVMAEMLKDTGIKTKVIKQYIPVINKLVNQYLSVLDFFVSFQLDETFTEEIRSRYRDTFSYDSFSEGEKQRIDLALLFTWRQIAKMKNSVATNLLILDETFDSSLDPDGVENLMKILYTLSDDTNVFVISHKGEILEGRFEKKIEFQKDKNFSVMMKG